MYNKGLYFKHKKNTYYDEIGLRGQNKNAILVKQFNS